MAKNPSPTPTQAEPEQKTEPSLPTVTEPVQIKGLSDDVTVAVTEINEPALLQQFSKDTMLDAQDDNRKMEFMKSIFEARQAKAPKPYTPPPVAPQVAEQTRLEMEAGAARVAHFEAQKPARHVQENTTMQSVFRPADYVPDQKKGQGLVPGKTYRTL